MKWCSGPCGRELPLTEFYVNTSGNPQGKCKGCHRVEARESYRRRAKRPGAKRLLAERARLAYRRNRCEEAEA